MCIPPWNFSSAMYVTDRLMFAENICRNFEMVKSGNRKSKKWVVAAAVAAAVIVAAVVTFLGLYRAGVFTSSQSASDYYYSADNMGLYTAVGDGFAAVSGSELQVFDKAGNLTVNKNFLMTQPRVASGGELALAYDAGGTAAEIFSDSGIVKSITASGNIISGKVNENGYVTLCVQETGYKGVVYVYNTKGEEIFEWLSGSAYVMTAAVSPDNKYLSVLSYTDTGTRVTKLRLSNEDYREDYEIPQVVGIDTDFAGSDILVLTGDVLYHIDGGGNITEMYNFNGKYLNAYVLGETATLVLRQHQAGGVSEIVSVEENGAVNGTQTAEGSVVALDANDRYTAVLTDSELRIYDTALREQIAYYEVTGGLEVILREKGDAIVAMRHSAHVYPADTK